MDVPSKGAGEKLLTVGELADWLGVPVRTVYEWRYRGEGPRGYKVGRHVRYRRQLVEQWLEEHADTDRRAA